MKHKTIELPPRIPETTSCIEIRDGSAYFVSIANGVPELDATALVEWARKLVDIWEDQRHLCNNCRKGTNYGTDGVFCNETHNWMTGIFDGYDKFGEDCDAFDPWPEEEEAE